MDTYRHASGKCFVLVDDNAINVSGIRQEDATRAGTRTAIFSDEEKTFVLDYDKFVKRFTPVTQPPIIVIESESVPPGEVRVVSFVGIGRPDSHFACKVHGLVLGVEIAPGITTCEACFKDERNKYEVDN